MIVFRKISELLARVVAALPPGAVTFLLLVLSALCGYLALFAPLNVRRRFLVGAL